MSEEKKEPSQAEVMKSVVQDLSASRDAWFKYDQLMLAMFEDISERMTTATNKLLKNLEQAISRSAVLSDAQKKMHQILEASLVDEKIEGLQKVTVMLKEKNEFHDELKGLLGIIQYNLLLRDRLGVLCEVLKVFMSTQPNEYTTAALKDLLLKYGTNLQHVWKIAESKCQSHVERQIIQQNINEKPAAPKSNAA